MTYCNEHSVVAREGENKRAASLKCRSWKCPQCAPDRQRRLIAQARGGKPNRLLTLTSIRNDKRTAEQAALELVLAWKIIFAEIRKQDGNKDAQFLAIFERTKLGWPHLHILLRSGWIDQKWLSARMCELTGAWHADIRKVKSERGAARYVAKYTAKGPGKFGTLKRSWCTPRWEVDQTNKKRPPLLWAYQRHTLRSWIEAYEDAGYRVELTGAAEAIAYGAAAHEELASA